MGCITSSTSFDEYCKTTEWYEWQEQLQIIQLHKADVEKLYSVFQRIDSDMTGHVHYLVLMGHLGADRSKFNVAVFSMFDEHQCKCVNFMEFVFVLWNYCTSSKDCLGKNFLLPLRTKTFILTSLLHRTICLRHVRHRMQWRFGLRGSAEHA